MALPPTIYRTQLQIADVDRGCYENLQLTVARHPSETAERLVARLLAYALCYQEGLVFTKGISAGDEPDLWLKTPDDRVQLWIEVGLPEADKLRKSSRHAGEVVLFAYGSHPRSLWQRDQLPRLGTLDNLRVYGLDTALMRFLVDRLQRGIDWSVTRTEGTLYLAVGGETCDAPLVLLYGAEGE